MPPRYQSTLLSFEEKARNLFDHFGQPAHRGHARLNGGAPALGSGGVAQSLIQNTGPKISAQGQLLVLSATADLIASAGDYITFDSEIYRHGFDAAVGADGQTVTWPVSFAGGFIQVEWAWDTYQGGGTIEIEVDGEVPAWGEVVAGTTGQTVVRSRPVHIGARQQVKIKVTQASGSAQAANVRVAFVASDPASLGRWEFVETVWLETRNVASVTSTETLAASESYRIVVTGNYDQVTGGSPNTAVGTPDPVMFPSSGQAASNDAAFDAECVYANSNAAAVLGHESRFTINTGPGAVHVEPVGGPFSSPATEHTYEYLVTGEGSTATFAHGDTPTNDNNGQFKIEIYRWVGA